MNVSAATSCLHSWTARPRSTTAFARICIAHNRTNVAHF
jgi:hypothetical protein